MRPKPPEKLGGLLVKLVLMRPVKITKEDKDNDKVDSNTGSGGNP